LLCFVVCTVTIVDDKAARDANMQLAVQLVRGQRIVKIETERRKTAVNAVTCEFAEALPLE